MFFNKKNSPRCLSRLKNNFQFQKTEHAKPSFYNMFSTEFYTPIVIFFFCDK